MIPILGYQALPGCEVHRIVSVACRGSESLAQAICGLLLLEFRMGSRLGARCCLNLWQVADTSVYPESPSGHSELLAGLGTAD